MTRYEDAIVAALLTLLTDLRKSQGLTLEGLADIAGVHRTTIGLLERQVRHPTVSMAVQIAQALGIPLSSLLRQAEEIVDTTGSRFVNPTDDTSSRFARPEHFHNEAALLKLTGLSCDALRRAIDSCHSTLDIIDAQLVGNGTPPLGRLIELANLSSMIGNLVGAAVADESDGLYKRNRPHAYPDLLPLIEPAINVEIKMALETNSPKGHLAKAGVYLTFRYVLATRDGTFVRGKQNRGDTAWFWEAKIGYLNESDFSISNTEGDSGKTAVIRTASFNRMNTVYQVPTLSPYARLPAFSNDQLRSTLDNT